MFFFTHGQTCPRIDIQLNWQKHYPQRIKCPTYLFNLNLTFRNLQHQIYFDTVATLKHWTTLTCSQLKNYMNREICPIPTVAVTSWKYICHWYKFNNFYFFKSKWTNCMFPGDIILFLLFVLTVHFENIFYLYSLLKHSYLLNALSLCMRI